MLTQMVGCNSDTLTPYVGRSDCRFRERRWWRTDVDSNPRGVCGRRKVDVEHSILAPRNDLLIDSSSNYFKYLWKPKHPSINNYTSAAPRTPPPSKTPRTAPFFKKKTRLFSKPLHAATCVAVTYKVFFLRERESTPRITSIRKIRRSEQAWFPELSKPLGGHPFTGTSKRHCLDARFQTRPGLRRSRQP